MRARRPEASVLGPLIQAKRASRRTAPPPESGGMEPAHWLGQGAQIMKEPFRLDLENIKRRAREHMSQGAVTESYGADREQVLKVLNEVLATEIVCNLRYRNNALVAQGIHAEAISAEFTEHAGQEQD